VRNSIYPPFRMSHTCIFFGSPDALKDPNHPESFEGALQFWSHRLEFPI
jgi:hypothetical protein